MPDCKRKMMMLPDSLDQWFAYLGRFHPVIVHLPIGILLLAFVMELGFYKKTTIPSPRQAVSFMLAVGCISASASCIAGWLLSKQGSYDESTLAVHQWMGIGVALFSGLCWLARRKKDIRTKAKPLYTVLMALLFLFLMIAGHNGGSMTHGDDYLTAEMPQWLTGENKDTTRFIRKPITDVNEAYIYADLVQNVLGDKCYSCHSAKKVKGGLRVDDEKLLFKGGKHGTVIRPGNAEESELIIRILLPEEDDKRMPPKKREPLTPEEIDLLKWWIQHGADTRKKVKDLSPDSSVLPVLASFAAPLANNSDSMAALSAVFDKELPPADQKTIDTLTSLGILVAPVAKNKNLLEISCVNYPEFDDDKMRLLTKIADHIVSLKLDGTRITDAAFDDISQFVNLVRLNIAHTPITGAAMAKLQQLAAIEYINVVGTKVDDEGLQKLNVLPGLKRVYCWNSLVTGKGLALFNQHKAIAVAE
ncbi:MAG: hypothetical protein KF746_16860 [Chitinophagaceae bacterium]|nr:hypothetical protein [Chitinophagaceae bacterium]